MNSTETFKSALSALLSNKARSFLTMLGVIIGVFAVITLVSLGNGIKNYISDQFESIGSNLVFVSPGKTIFAGDPGRSLTDNKLREKHVELINTYASEYISAVTPSVRVGKTIRYKTKSFYADVNGGNQYSPEIFKREITSGRYYNEADIRSKNKVAAIGSQVVLNLFGNVNPIGKKIDVGDKSFEVIGILGPKGHNFDDNLSVPYTVVQDMFNIDNISNIIVKAKNPDDIDIAMKYIKLALLRDLKEDDFSVLSQQDVLSTVQNILTALTAGIGAIAGISLLVGGIGIMNIMLVSVTERIQEIGLRKASGATSFNIAAQFLLEATLLSLIGGTIGLILGYLGSLIINNFVATSVSWWSVLLAFGFSALVGIVFGTYPAYKASKKDPIEALRYE